MKALYQTEELIFAGDPIGPGFFYVGDISPPDAIDRRMNSHPFALLIFISAIILFILISL
jgi:hypothetical protein